MSYILEALKKAQAERQLGALPTIHALPAIGGAAPAAPRRAGLWLALLGMALLALTLLGMLWRRPAPVAAVPAQAAAPIATPAAVVPAPVVAELAVPVQAPNPAPVRARPAPPVQAPARRGAPPIAPPPPRAELAAVLAPRPAAPEPVAVATDESLPTVRELPEPIQRQIPPIALGGYIYSKNPADRLLLIDKVLRHEGEELAPGMVLERLLPKAAVINFQGYRYRVPY